MASTFQKLSHKQVSDLQSIVQSIIQSSHIPRGYVQEGFTPEQQEPNLATIPIQSLMLELSHRNTIISQLATMTMSILEQMSRALTQKQQILVDKQQLRGQLQMQRNQMYELKQSYEHGKINNNQLSGRVESLVLERDQWIYRCEELSFQVQQHRIKCKQQKQLLSEQIQQLKSKILKYEQKQQGKNNQLMNSISQLCQHNQKLKLQLVKTNKQLDNVVEQLHKTKQQIYQKSCISIKNFGKDTYANIVEQQNIIDHIRIVQNCNYQHLDIEDQDLFGYQRLQYSRTRQYNLEDHINQQNVVSSIKNKDCNGYMQRQVQRGRDRQGQGEQNVMFGSISSTLRLQLQNSLGKHKQQQHQPKQQICLDIQVLSKQQEECQIQKHQEFQNTTKQKKSTHYWPNGQQNILLKTQINIEIQKQKIGEQYKNLILNQDNNSKFANIINEQRTKNRTILTQNKKISPQKDYKLSNNINVTNSHHINSASKTTNINQNINASTDTKTKLSKQSSHCLVTKQTNQQPSKKETLLQNNRNSQAQNLGQTCYGKIVKARSQARIRKSNSNKMYTQPSTHNSRLYQNSLQHNLNHQGEVNRAKNSSLFNSTPMQKGKDAVVWNSIDHSKVNNYNQDIHHSSINQENLPQDQTQDYGNLFKSQKIGPNVHVEYIQSLNKLETVPEWQFSCKNSNNSNNSMYNFKKQKVPKNGQTSRLKYLINTIGGKQDYKYQRKQKFKLEKQHMQVEQDKKFKNKVLQHKEGNTIWTLKHTKSGMLHNSLYKYTSLNQCNSCDNLRRNVSNDDYNDNRDNVVNGMNINNKVAFNINGITPVNQIVYHNQTNIKTNHNNCHLNALSNSGNYMMKKIKN